MNAPIPSPPTASARNLEARNDLVFGAIVETCDLVTSYAVSAREAAWRGDRKLLTGHLAQLRACVVAALDAHKLLGPIPEVGANG